MLRIEYFKGSIRLGTNVAKIRELWHSDAKCALFFFPYHVVDFKKVLHVTRNTGHGDDVEKMKKIILGTTRPENVRNIVSKFEKELLGTKFLTLHWRYDMKDWYVHCKRDKNQNIPPDAPCRLVMK